jgi:tetratricopeptide (TPR) repeat protein
MRKYLVMIIGLFLALSAQACFGIEAKDKDLFSKLEKMSAQYFEKNDYDGLYAELSGLSIKELSSSAEVYYFLALTRQKEIAFWRAMKNWEGVYDKAENIKKSISANLNEAQTLAKGNAGLIFDIKYLKWQSIKDDDPDAARELFNDLVKSAEAVEAGPEMLDKIKAAADELSKLQDKNLSRRLYEIYVARLSNSNLPKEKIKAQAEGFLEEGSGYLAKSLFDVYLNQLADDKVAQAKEMVSVASKFAHSGWKEGLDPIYAESMYKKAFDLAGIPAFDSASAYQRAFNLERLKEYPDASDEYRNLLASFSDTVQKAEIYFRIGVIAAYAAKDIDKAYEYFSKIKDEFPKTPYFLSSLYQSGLLHQWKQELDQAKENYDLLLKYAQDEGVDIQKTELALLAQERLKEIEEKKEIKYGLRLFLEGTFKSGIESGPSSLSVDLTGRAAKGNIGKPVAFVVTTSNSQTGCMTPAYSYEWSGEVGTLSNIPNSPEITTDFPEAGIKVTHVAVVGNQGAEGVGFEMIQKE